MDDPAIIAQALSLAIREVFPDAVETRDKSDHGFGFGTGYKDLVFVVTPQKSHVTLGIAHGAGLPDPTGLLEGTGKIHRHIKLRTLADIQNADLRQRMLSAIEAAMRRRQMGA